MATHNTWRFAFLLVTCASLSLADATGQDTDPVGLTFFGWSDQHVQTDGDAQHLIPALDAMNALPGKPYPEDVGGKVAEPAFVFGCGDITEWPTHAAVAAYSQLMSERLKFSSYDVLGNHDQGGKVPSETAATWMNSRHGALNYTFSKGGVQFVAVVSKYDESLNRPDQPLSDDALRFIRERLAEVPDGDPVIVATHLCFDAITNRDALVDSLGNANVLAILGGHYHKAKLNMYRDHRFVQLPSPAPGSPDEFTVFRITSDRIIAIPYDYRQQQWNGNREKWLDYQFSRGEDGGP